MRRWPSSGLPAARLQGLHQLLEHLARQGVETVAVPIPDDSGYTPISQDGAWWQIEPWLPGTADYRTHPHPRRLQAALAALAQWHAAAARFMPERPAQAWFSSVESAPSPAIVERLELCRSLPQKLLSLQQVLEQSAGGEQQTLGRELLRQIQRHMPAVMQELSTWRDRRFSLQPCLRDIWHDHVLFTEDRVTGLIDPSACRTEHVASDLSRLIGSLVEDDVDGWQTALAAYQRHRPLTLDELALVTVLDRSGVLLSAGTWLDWLYGQRRTFQHPEKVLERLRHFQRRFQALDAWA